MPLPTLSSFLFLSASFLSLWLKKDPKLWGSLLGVSLLSGFIAGNVSEIGLVLASCLLLLWILYHHKKTFLLFLFIICLSVSFKMGFLPGFTPFFLTPKFALGLEAPLIGLFPLAFCVPLARKIQEGNPIIKGILFGCVGIGVLAVLATLSGATHWQFKTPSFLFARLFSNLFLTCIPEEGLYRGFIQTTLCKYFAKSRFGTLFALLITSLLFTLTHLYWSPDLQILLFVFLAGLLYGGVYLISGKIESSIICHFLLNFIHMTFFSYHAM